MKNIFLFFIILGEINKRKHFRNRKARDERRREKFIEMEENKKLGKCNCFKKNYTLHIFKNENSFMH